MTTATINVIDRNGNASLIAWEAGQTLMEALRDNDLPVLASCGGCCSCATCHVLLAPDFARIVGPSAGEERDLLEQTSSFRPEASRLACQIPHDPVYEGLSVTLAPDD